MMLANTTKKQGFSLVETLVAISILLIVITGPMAISMRTAKSTSFASEQVQAFFLAQEGIELAQKGRDELLLKNFLPSTDANYIANPWALFTDTSASGYFRHCYAATGCGLQWDPNPATGNLDSVRSCSALNNCLLHLSTNNRSRFTYNSGAGSIPTPFTRKIYFSSPAAGQVQVRSVVTWRTGSLVAEQKVETVTYLYNIYGTP